MASKKFENQELLDRFKKECYLIDFDQEYGKDHGIEAPWGFATNLSANEMEQKYGALISHFGYRPYLILPEQYAEPYADSRRNDKKFEHRMAVDDAYGINEFSDVFHPELTYSMESSRFELDPVRAVFANLSILTTRQRYIFHLLLDCGLSEKEIAAHLGTNLYNTRKLVDRIFFRIGKFSEERRKQEAI